VYNGFMAPWSLSGTTQVSRYQKGKNQTATQDNSSSYPQWIGLQQGGTQVLLTELVD